MGLMLVPASQTFGTDAYPEIRRSSVEIKVESLGWCADLNRAKILRIVLLVFSCHLAGIRSSWSCPLRENTVSLCLAADLMQKTMVTSLRNLVHLKVWTRLSGLEAPFLKKVDIGFGTGFLVLRVVDELNLLQALKSSHDV